MTLVARDLAAAPRAAVRPLTLGLLTPHNIHDPRAFSGTVYHAARALLRSDAIRLRVLGDHRPPGLGDRLARRLGRTPAPAAPPTPADLRGLDAVVGLVASGLLDQLPPGVPYIHVTDATPGFLAEAYGWDIAPETHAREARVAARAAACLYSSGTMAARARDELGLARTRAVPFGVNLTARPRTRPWKPPLDPLDLLFVGADWDRKGGGIALGALDRLRAAGHPARLTLVGRIPDHARGRPGVTVAGYLDKTRTRDAARLAALYARAHLLVLPTRGDCTPMVIAEAMAHGTPVLATRTGGIPEMLGGAGAGRALDRAAGAEDWAQAIRDIAADTAGWEMMSDAAFDRAQAVFSWDVWAARVAEAARAALARTRRAA